MAAPDDDAPAEVDADDARDDDEPDDTAPEGDGGDAAPEDGATDEAVDPPDRPRRRAIDGRTLAICVLVAFIAATATYLGVSALTSDDDTGAAEPQEAELTPAEDVPDVPLERFDGTEVSPTDFRGQPLVLNFWASWCVPCTEEMPDFQQVHESLGDQVAFLGVNVRDQVETAEAMAERTGVTYELARDTTGDLARDLGVANLPVTVIVDADGTVLETLHSQVSSERLCEVINQTVLNQSLDEGGCG